AFEPIEIYAGDGDWIAARRELTGAAERDRPVASPPLRARIDPGGELVVEHVIARAVDGMARLRGPLPIEPAEVSLKALSRDAPLRVPLSVAGTDAPAVATARIELETAEQDVSFDAPFVWLGRGGRVSRDEGVVDNGVLRFRASPD